MSTPTFSGPAQAWNFCGYCNHKISFQAKTCPECGAPQERGKVTETGEPVSPKNYGTAVALCGVFGVMGIHHFYLGNILHGLFDLALFFGWFVPWVAVSTGDLRDWMGMIVLMFVIDALHTAYVFFMLICGRQRDGKGRLVALPDSTV